MFWSHGGVSPPFGDGSAAKRTQERRNPGHTAALTCAAAIGVADHVEEPRCAHGLYLWDPIGPYGTVPRGLVKSAFEARLRPIYGRSVRPERIGGRSSGPGPRPVKPVAATAPRGSNHLFLSARPISRPEFSTASSNAGQY